MLVCLQAQWRAVSCDECVPVPSTWAPAKTRTWAPAGEPRMQVRCKGGILGTIYVVSALHTFSYSTSNAIHKKKDKYSAVVCCYLTHIDLSGSDRGHCHGLGSQCDPPRHGLPQRRGLLRTWFHFQRVDGNRGLYSSQVPKGHMRSTVWIGPCPADSPQWLSRIPSSSFS